MAAVNPSGLKREPDNRIFSSEQHPALADKHPKLPSLPLPDLRYEQSILKSLTPFLHTSPVPHHDEALAETASLVQTAHPPADLDLWRDIEWGPALWLIFRDQIAYQLVSGTFLSMLTLTVWPLGQKMLSGIFGGSRKGSGAAPATKEGGGAGWLRRLGGSLLGGPRR